MFSQEEAYKELIGSVLRSLKDRVLDITGGYAPTFLEQKKGMSNIYCAHFHEEDLDSVLDIFKDVMITFARHFAGDFFGDRIETKVAPKVFSLKVDIERTNELEVSLVPEPYFVKITSSKYLHATLSMNLIPVFCSISGKEYSLFQRAILPLSEENSEIKVADELSLTTVFTDTKRMRWVFDYLLDLRDSGWILGEKPQKINLEDDYKVHYYATLYHKDAISKIQWRHNHEGTKIHIGKEVLNGPLAVALLLEIHFTLPRAKV